MRIRKKDKFNCFFCGEEFLRIKYSVRDPNKTFCSSKHYGEWMKTALLGENNPNFGKKWSDEQKEKAGNKLKIVFSDPEIRYKIGSANRGKKFTQEHIDKCHKNRIRPTCVHSEETKKLIGQKSKQKFTNEFKQKQRKLRETNGNWIPLSDKSDYQIYCKESNWIEKMWNLVEDKNNLLKTNGVFNSKNTKGVVRDHIFGRRHGFELKIFPEILRHPCNCQIILHRENVIKHFKQEKGFDYIELVNKIKEYKGSWQEQEIALQKIKDYESGMRWTNQHKQEFFQ